MNCFKKLFSIRVCCCVLLVLFNSSTQVFAQCNATITSFPYYENFESNEGNWTAGGTNSDWAYGTPNKLLINSAASGTKCWVVGGLTGNFYNNGENSYLLSPCYNFSTLTNPQIAFNIFWETERRYDGASFQYTIDGGNVWQTLGSINSNSNCTGNNWFNFSPINALGVAGWSGTISPTQGSCLGTGGSDGWTNAKHILAGLGGQANVRFRFIFGAGTACNAFNGFAVDDITINDAAPNTANFIYTCNSANAVQFTNASSVCASNFIWNFGDTNSPSNISNAENPIHTFSIPGTYTISLTVTFPNNIIVTEIKTVTVLNVTIQVAQTIQCNGNSNGSLTAIVNGGNGNYNYSWNTTPPKTTATASSLIAGNYAVVVSAANTCTTTSNYILAQPAALTSNPVVSAEICGKKNGSIVTNIAGGIMPYSFTWSNGATANNLQNLSAGNYSLTVKDANNCLLSPSFTVKDSVNILLLNLGKDTSFCPGNSTVLQAGNFSQYLWQNNTTNSTFTVTTTGKYFVRVTDAAGCTASDTINVYVDCSDIYFPSAFTPNKDGLNDLFGAIGNVNALTSFSLQVFGRWGQLVFSTNNPFEKWDGKQNGIDMDLGVYVFMATYSINNQIAKNKKGTIMLMR
jgi:gliding motility-associated-like protein